MNVYNATKQFKIVNVVVYLLLPYHIVQNTNRMKDIKRGMFSSLFISIFSGISQKNKQLCMWSLQWRQCAAGVPLRTQREVILQGRSSQTGRDRFSETLTWQSISTVLLGLGWVLVSCPQRPERIYWHAHVPHWLWAPAFQHGAPTCSLAAHSSMVGFPHAREVSNLLLFSVARWAPNPWRAAVLAWED